MNKLHIEKCLNSLWLFNKKYTKGNRYEEKIFNFTIYFIGLANSMR